jgi:hypothetical protein
VNAPTVIRCVLAAAVICAAPKHILGQERQDEIIIQKLLGRVEALEREVAALKQTALAPSQARQVQPAPSDLAPVAAAPQQDTTVTADLPEPEPVEPPEYTFHGYADTGFLRNEDGLSDKRFNLGEIDFFATARISPKLNALVEVVLETDNQLQVAQVPLNLERLLLQYRENKYFNLDIGSYRTAVGFYNTTLRGSWLQTALTRPAIFTFEDDGGFLPLHNVGLSANGIVPSGNLGLHYVAEVGSSRNYAQSGRTGLDLEQNAAVNVALYARPHIIPGFQIGVSSYHDRFSPAPGPTLARSVWTAHAVYQANRFEFLNEVVLARFREPRLGYGDVPGFYSQLGYRLGSNWTPYARYDWANIYGRGQVAQYTTQYVPWRTVFSGGIRYDLTESLALKFELGRETSPLQLPWIRAALQVAFTF